MRSRRARCLSSRGEEGRSKLLTPLFSPFFPAHRAPPRHRDGHDAASARGNPRRGLGAPCDPSGRRVPVELDLDALALPVGPRPCLCLVDLRGAAEADACAGVLRPQSAGQEVPARLCARLCAAHRDDGRRRVRPLRPALLSFRSTPSFVFLRQNYVCFLATMPPFQAS